MKPLIKVMLCSIILTGCGGSDGGSTSVPQVNQGGECTIAGQNQSLIDYLQDHYYWYQDLPSLNAASFNSPNELLEAARVPIDRFSFMLTQAQYDATYVNANFVGLGLSYRIAADNQSLEVRYVYDNGAAFDAGMARGDKITAVDGINVAQLANDVQTGNKSWSGIFGAGIVGTVVNLNWHKPSGHSDSQGLVKTEVDTNTVLASKVMTTTNNKNVGYMVFNSFIERAKIDLNLVFDQFVQNNVQELVLDLRYNGGGSVNVANQLSTQIGGTNVQGNIFVHLQHNDKHPENNSTSMFQLGAGVNQLNLDKVVVLTTGATCSASELVVNALSPFIEVVTVGSDTCGKPIGMNPVQICDNVIFAINFETTNALNVGGYFDGLPVHCFAQDQIVADWGSVDDPLLREGLYYINNGQCFSPPQIHQKDTIKQTFSPVDYRQGPLKARNDI